MEHVMAERLTGLNGRYDLDGGRASTNDCRRLTFQVVAGVPLCTVHQFAFEEVDSWDVRIPPGATIVSVAVIGSGYVISLQHAGAVD